MRTFEKVVSKYSLDDMTFPYAEQGRRYARIELFIFNTLIAFLCSMLGFRIFQYLLTLFEIKPLEFFQWKYDAAQLTNLIQSVNVIKISLRGILVFACLFAIVRFFHCGNAIKRMRLFERKCIHNDGAAVRLKNLMLRKSGFKTGRRLARVDLQKARRSSVSSTDARLSSLQSVMKAKEAIAIYDSLCGVKVTYNTRNSVDDDNVYDFVNVTFLLPLDSEARKQILSKIEKFHEFLTVITKNKLQFGQGQFSEDLDRMNFVAKRLIQAQEKVETKKISQEKYETVFPLTLLKDQTELIEKLNAGAQKWSVKTGKALNVILSTKKENVTYKKCIVGSASATYFYELQFSLDIKDFTKYGEMFDQIFHTKGCVASIESGELAITITLPDSLKKPIDVRTLFKEVFGC